jgi:hypothetical protein
MEKISASHHDATVPYVHIHLCMCLYLSLSIYLLLVIFVEVHIHYTYILQFIPSWWSFKMETRPYVSLKIIYLAHITIIYPI